MSVYWQHKNVKHGFTLIEVLIATGIASMLAASLFYSYAQINKIVVYMTDYVDMFSTAILVDQVLSKDTAGAFFPVQAILAKAKNQKVSPEQKNKVEPDAKKQNNMNEQKSVGAQVQQQKEKKQLLKDPFISKNRDKNLSMLSFITNNPKRIFWGAKSGEPKPSIARVVYTLQENKESSKQKQSFSLYRQEGIDLNLNAYTKKDSSIERYQIADNIKECKMTFEVRVEPEEGKEGPAEIKTFHDWKVGKDEQDMRSKVKLPHKIIMELIVWDSFKLKDHTFKLAMPVMVDFQELPEPESAEQKKDQNATKSQEEQDKRKETLVSSANTVVGNIRSLFGK